MSRGNELWEKGRTKHTSHLRQKYRMRDEWGQQIEEGKYGENS